MNFYLPDFYNKYKLNTKIIELFKSHPEYFQDNININTIYGCFPGMIWNGGRAFLGFTNINDIKSIINTLNNKNISIRFTMTNNCINESHLNDTYCNTILDLAHNSKNGIIINSPILESYLRDTYPKYKYILSTTRCERDINKINEACDKYDMVVIDYRDNNNFDFLNSIQNKDKIEILLNSYCNPNCTLRQEHYNLLSQKQLYGQVNNKKIDKCPTADRSFYEALDFPTVIKKNDLYNIYTKMGFNNFKIEGRLVHLIDVIESYIYYLIKSEYADKIRLILLKYCVNWQE